MQVPVEQVLDILPQVGYFFAVFNQFLQFIGMPKLQDPEHDDRRDHKAGDHAGQQDLLRIVTG